MSGTRRQGKAGLMIIIVLALVGAGIGFFAIRSDGKDEVSFSVATFVAEKTDLVISVREGGTLQSAEPFEVKSEIEGSATILALAPEGTFVEEGDLLVELDASTLFDDRNRQEISFANAEASKLQAEKAVEIQKSLNTSKIAQADLAVDLANQDLNKYLEADFEQQKKTLASEITLAKAELERAREQLAGSIELAEQGYISNLEKTADELALERRKLDLELAVEKERILLDYEYDRQLKILRSDLDQARMELDRARSEAVADLASIEADFAAKTATLDLETRRLNRINDQIEKAKVYAPKGGLVVYANISQGRRGGDDRPIEVAASIRERQLILSVTDSDRMLVEAKIHESAVDKVKVGQRVRVTVDAVQGTEFLGVVEKVALLPDSQNMWLNPDLKVYSTRISLDTSSENPEESSRQLRPGMSCTAEIVCAALRDVVTVPLQAVFPSGPKYFCYVAEGEGAELREVEVGLHNDRMVQVEKGLESGEIVFLAKPPGAPEPENSSQSEEFESDFDLASETLTSTDNPTGGIGGADGRTMTRAKGGPNARGGRKSRGEGGRPGADSGAGGTGYSPEELEKRKKQFEAMSEEQKAELMKKFRNGGGGQGG